MCASWRESNHPSSGCAQDHRVFFHVHEDAIEILRVRDRKEAYR